MLISDLNHNHDNIYIFDRFLPDWSQNVVSWLWKEMISLGKQFSPIGSKMRKKMNQSWGIMKIIVINVLSQKLYSHSLYLKSISTLKISYHRWRRGQEELIEGLFFWLGTPLLKLVMETCRPVFTPIANGLIRFETCILFAMA